MLALAVVSAGACASGGGPAEDGEPGADGFRVQIENDAVPPTALVVWIVPRTGPREMLGTVDPGTNRTFGVEARLAPDRYRLVAETTAGAEIVSRPFTVTDDVSGLTWDLGVNSVTTH
jgi:hypothetical protein